MKQTARWVAIIALFTIPFLPLYVSNDLFFPFITGKNFAFRILVEIAFCAWALLAVLDRAYRPRFSWTFALLAGLVAWMAVADSFGVLPYKAFWSNFERMDGWVTLAHLLALFVTAGSLLSVETLWRRWWLFFVGVSAAVCAFGIIQASGGADIHQGGVRLDATFGNAIYLAVYLMFSILMAGWLLVSSKGWVRYALAGSAILSLVILLLTASRGPAIGLAAGIAAGSALWLALALRDRGAKNAMSVRIAAGALAGLVILVGGFFLARDSAFVQGSPALTRLASVFTLSQELQVRSTIWSIALKGAAEDPLTGWGQEGFNQVFNAQYEPSLYAQESWFDRAHNMYLDWLVAGGIPALALFLALLITATFALLRTSAYARAERVLLIAALVAYAVQALVVFDNLFSYVPLVMLLAMAHAAGNRAIARVDRLPELRDEAHVGIAATSAGVLAIALIVLVNVPGIRAANHLVHAISPARDVSANLAYFKDALADRSFADQEIREQLALFAGRVAGEASLPVSVRSEFTAFAADEMGKQVALSPRDARLRIQYADALDAAGKPEEGLAQIDAALALSPRKQMILLTKGYALYRMGRIDEAYAAFAAAYDLDPSFEQVARAAAAGYLVSGKVAEGKALLLHTFGTTTPDDDAIFYAYYQAKQWPELIAVARARVANQNGSPESRYRLAQALAAAGRFPAAVAEVQATMAANPSARAQGEALLKQVTQPAR